MIPPPEPALRSRRHRRNFFHEVVVTVTAICALAGVLALFLKGGASSGSTAGVALVELDLVAKALGKDIEMAATIKAGQDAAANHIEELTLRLQKQYEAEKAVIGLILDETGKQKAAQLEQDLGRQLEEARQKVAADLRQKSLDLVKGFRAEITPHALAVARERGLDVILTKNASVIFHAAPACDITQAVIDRMQPSGSPPGPSGECSGVTGTGSGTRSAAGRFLTPDGSPIGLPPIGSCGTQWFRLKPLHVRSSHA